MDLQASLDWLSVPYVLLSPDLRIVTANRSYLESVDRELPGLVGRPLFDAFPPAADAVDADGVPFTRTFLESVRDSGRSDAMPVFRYDIADRAGQTRERHWRLSADPVLDDDGQVNLIVQRAEDVTDFVLQRNLPLLERVQDIESDLFELNQTLGTTLAARDLAVLRLAGLNDAATALTAAVTVQDIAATVLHQGRAAFGFAGGSVVSRDPSGGWCVTGQRRAGTWGPGDVLLADSPLPAVVAAREGRRILLPSRDSGVAFHPVMSDVYDATGSLGWAVVPLTVADRCLGSLTVSWADEHVCDDDELALLDGFAAQCALTLDRIEAAREREAAAEEVSRMSEGLQRALLPRLPPVDGLEVTARYQPAAQQARVGGDWYDAFRTARGLNLVIGDVTGHDQDAAVAMSQVRNLLRGVAHALPDAPATVLWALDRALEDLVVGTLATAVLATLDEPVGPDLPWTLRWTNAGHPPPLLLHPDGSAELLDRPADLLLGLDHTSARSGHTADLATGSTLVLYTDGLVERRAEDLDVGLERLRQAAQAVAQLPLEQVCDVLLKQLAAAADDDVAVLALRVLAPRGLPGLDRISS